MQRFEWFDTPEERLQIAQEIMEAGRVECETKGVGPDGADELIVQRVVEWRVKAGALGAYCVLRHYTHRNEFENGEVVRKPAPFFHLLFDYDRPDGGRASLSMRLDHENSNIINSSPLPGIIWDEAMAHFDEALRCMRARINGVEYEPTPLHERSEAAFEQMTELLTAA